MKRSLRKKRPRIVTSKSRKRRLRNHRSLRNRRRTRRLKHGDSGEKAYRAGLYEGGEKILESHLPGDVLITDISMDEAVAQGVRHLRSRGLPLLGPSEVCNEIEAAISEKRPYSFIRLGDGELLTLAQEKVLGIDEVRRAGRFLPRAGVIIPDLQARDELAACIRAASLIGVPTSRKPSFQPLFFSALREHGIDSRTLQYTTSIMNYKLYENGLMTELVKGHKILVVGNIAKQFSRYLMQQGVRIAGAVSPVEGFRDFRRALDEASRYDFDLALVSAGVAAVPIAVHLAQKTGKVAIDFGHVANHWAGLPRFARD